MFLLKSFLHCGLFIACVLTSARVVPGKWIYTSTNEKHRTIRFCGEFIFAAPFYFPKWIRVSSYSSSSPLPYPSSSSYSSPFASFPATNLYRVLVFPRMLSIPFLPALITIMSIVTIYTVYVISSYSNRTRFCFWSLISRGGKQYNTTRDLSFTHRFWWRFPNTET